MSAHETYFDQAESPPGVYDAWRVQEYASRGPFWEQLQAVIAERDALRAALAELLETHRNAGGGPRLHIAAVKARNAARRLLAPHPPTNG